MKLLCVADEVDLLVYSASIRERFADIDLILGAGDLPGEYLGFIVSMLNRPLVAVAGNHDPDINRLKKMNGTEGYFQNPGGEQGLALGLLSFGLRKEAGLWILGIPGCMRHNSGTNQYSDFEMNLKLALLTPLLALRRLLFGRAADIILTHAPPLGIHDGQDLCHKGFSSFLWLMKLVNPLYFIHGHVHLYDAREGREVTFGSTKIINVYGHRVIEMETGDS